MLAVGILALLAAEILADIADVIGGTLSLDALRGTDVAFDERIHQARPHAGQLKTAANLRKMLEGSTLRESHLDCERVQDAYSLRCMPQVHGAVRDTLAHCRDVMEIETNSAVDNPLVFLRKDSEAHVISGGNFHGQPLAFVRFSGYRSYCPGWYLRAQIGASGKPRSQRRPAAIPRSRRRTEFRLHDGTGLSRVAGQRK